MNANTARSIELWTDGERRRLLQSMAVLPDPKHVALSLPECALLALKHAEQGHWGQYRLRHGVRDMEAGQILFRAGCVEARGPYVGNFGMKVRREAISLLAEREFGG